MNKTQALQTFYESFGIPAYEENTVPDDAKMPYIIYEVATSQHDEQATALSCQIWYKSNSWSAINAKTEELSQALSGGYNIKCDTGIITLERGNPFAQNRPTEDKTVKCKYINITAHYNTL